MENVGRMGCLLKLCVQQPSPFAPPGSLITGKSRGWPASLFWANCSGVDSLGLSLAPGSLATLQRVQIQDQEIFYNQILPCQAGTVTPLLSHSNSSALRWGVFFGASFLVPVSHQFARQSCFKQSHAMVLFRSRRPDSLAKVAEAQTSLNCSTKPGRLQFSPHLRKWTI